MQILKMMVLVILFLIILNISIMSNNEIILKNGFSVSYERCLNFLLTSQEFDVIIEKEIIEEEFIYRIVINFVNENIRIQSDNCFSFKSAVFSIILDMDKMNLL